MTTEAAGPSDVDACLAALRWLGDPQPSPSGEQIAYVETRLDRQADTVASRVGVVPAAGGGTAWLGDGDSPRWSPDGRRLVVRRTGPAGGGPELWLVEVGSGTARPLTGGGTASTDVPATWAAEPAWSPDGSRLAYTRTHRRESPDGVRVDGLPGLYRQDRRVHVVDVHGHPQWTVGGDGYRPQWSPDGTRLGLLTTRFGPRPDLCWLDGSGAGPPVRVSDGGGPVRGYAWSPEGGRLAYLTHRHGDAADVNLRLWVAGVDGSGEPVELTRGWRLGLGNPVRGDDPRGTGDAPVAWSAATGRIYLEVATGGRGPLAWFAAGTDAAGGSPRALTAGPSGLLFDGEHVCLAPAVGGGRLAFVRTDPANPGDVHVADERTGAARAVTDANPGLAGSAAPTAALRVRAEDGTAVDAWLTAAPGPAPRPLLVNVHGGPHGAVGWRFTAETQRMAARGYAVLTLNPRGSQGYGEDFACAIRGDWGGVDWSDVLAAADTASRLRTVDGSRAAIWGVSYGGFMAMWAVTRTGRFAAAVSENGRSDLVGAWDRVTTPLMLIHAQDDQVCPVAQSERARAALRALGREVELVRIPGEGHLMNLVGRPSSRQRRADAIDRFLAAALRPDAAPSG